MYQHEATKLWVRDVGHEGIIKEQNDWKKIIPYGPFKVVLDIGAHIGAFTWWAKQHLGIEQIVAVEPDPNNIEVFVKNHPDIKLMVGAVVSSAQHEARQLPLWLGKTYSACNSLEKYQGRHSIMVPTLDFREVIAEVAPNLIKCDIEGGEYSLDFTCMPDQVKALCFEFHYHREHWLEHQKRIDKDLLDQGFNHVNAPANKVPFTKACIALYVRS